MSTNILCVIVVLLICYEPIICGNGNNQRLASVGTTPNIEEIFIGKCWEYQHLVNPDVFHVNYECSVLWELFSSAFAYKEPCNVTMDDYIPFCDAAVHNLSTSQSLLWENVYPLVNDYSLNGKRYTTISDTLLGYMADDMLWCGQIEVPGINYDNCPTWSECEIVNGQVADYTYWQMTSEYFAAEVTGIVHFLINGSSTPPYDPNSIFAKHELPNLTPERGVHDLYIVVLHDIGGSVIESCGEGTLLELQNIAVAQGLLVTCENNPPSLRHYQCVDMPTDPECIISSIPTSALTLHGTSIWILIVGCLYSNIMLNMMKLN